MQVRRAVMLPTTATPRGRTVEVGISMSAGRDAGDSSSICEFQGIGSCTVMKRKLIDIA